MIQLAFSLGLVLVSFKYIYIYIELPYIMQVLISWVDVEKANDETREQLLQLVPTYDSLASSSKVHLIQSLVSRLLVEHIFSKYFIGLSKEHADDLSKVEQYLGEFGETSKLPETFELIADWI